MTKNNIRIFNLPKESIQDLMRIQYEVDGNQNQLIFINTCNLAIDSYEELLNKYIDSYIISSLLLNSYAKALLSEDEFNKFKTVKIDFISQTLEVTFNEVA